jgi:hypothetical protein
MSASAVAGVLAIHEEKGYGAVYSSSGIRGASGADGRAAPQREAAAAASSGGKVAYHSTNTHPSTPSRSPSMTSAHQPPAASQIAATLAAGSAANSRDKLRPKSPNRSPSPPTVRCGC